MSTLAWQVFVTEPEQGFPSFMGYGDTPAAAVQDLYAKIEAQATEATARAAKIHADLVRVRGEVEARS